MKLRAISWASVSSLPQAAEDKISIDEQLRLNAEWCAANDAEIIETLVIPGHSRYESDLIELLEDYAKQGIWAYHRIRDHWKARDFDLVVCYHDSRFGRSSTAYNYVAENVIRSGGRIYRINGGWLDASNIHFGLALGSIAATTGVSQLVEGRKMGMKRRAQRGLPVSSTPAMTHILIRDERGKPAKMIVDESLRPLFDDLYRAYVDLRTSYRQIEKVMFELGHAADTGQPYQPLRFYALLTNPVTHGHVAQHYRVDHDFAWVGPWMFKPGYPVPDRVTIYYNTHEAVWTGDQFERIFEEFQRRQSLGKRSGGNQSRAFTGLIVCGECGYTLVYNNNITRRSLGMRCMSHYNTSATRPDCTQNYWYNEKKIRDWFTTHLEQLIATRDWSAFFGLPAAPSVDAELQTVTDEIVQVNRRILRLIEDQSRQSSPAVIELYDHKIATAGQRLDHLQSRQDDLARQSTTSRETTRQRDYTLDEIASMGIDAFWQLPPGEINQMLHRIMGRRRIETRDSHITATREARPYHRRTK